MPATLFMGDNKIIIITAPSGAGKTSITRFLLNKYSSLSFSVSATTRPPRSNEKDGADYYFISVAQFPADAFSIFIQPPSIEALRQRLLNRGTETADSLQTRLSKASYELSFTHAFDSVIINDNFEVACKETEVAIRSFLSDTLR